MLHGQPHKAFSRGRLIPLVSAALLVATVIAAPAAAAPTPTTLKVTAQSTSVNWGSTAILNGVLQTAELPPLPVDGEQVRVEFASSLPGQWNLEDTVTNNAAPYTSGAYTYGWTATRNYYWRMNYLGSTAFAPHVGNFVYVKVRPVLGRPRCPKAIKHGRKFRVYGSLKPQYKTGSRTVRVKAQRYSRGKWRLYKTYRATITNPSSWKYSKYSLRISISKKGKYRFYATKAKTSALAAGKSGYSRLLRVR